MVEAINPIDLVEMQSSPNYQAIIVLGRGIGWDNKNGIWRPQSYFVRAPIHSGVFENDVDPNDNTLVAGGNLNTLALFHKYTRLVRSGIFPDLVVFSAGRPNYLADEEEYLTEGRVMKEKFLSKLVASKAPIITPPEIVILEKNKNTQDDMEESLKTLRERGIRRAAIITVRLQIERAEAFLKLAHENAGTTSEYINIDFLSAEDILSEIDPRYQTRFSYVDKYKGYLRTQAMEKRGLEALKNGTYFSEQLSVAKTR
jgi:hypothetical protein